MISYEFYKSLYDRELARRIDLDNALNIPITVMTVLVAANAYTMKGFGIIHGFEDLRIAHLIFVLLSLALITSIFFMMKSSNNLLKGFAYQNCSFVSEIRNYEQQVIDYNLNAQEKMKIDFQSIIITKLIEWTDNHIGYNDKRSRDLYRCRVYLSIALILTALNFFLIILKHIKL